MSSNFDDFDPYADPDVVDPESTKQWAAGNDVIDDLEDDTKVEGSAIGGGSDSDDSENSNDSENSENSENSCDCFGGCSNCGGSVPIYGGAGGGIFQLLIGGGSADADGLSRPYEVPDQTLVQDDKIRGAAAAKQVAIDKLDADTAESLSTERHKYRDEIATGLRITEKSIRTNGWIITGGMAIDAALRLKGYQLYPDHILPDWDFFTPDFHTVSYDIANSIATETNENTIINVISAMHPSTLRTRVYFTVVSDATYVPKVLFSRIPTIKYNGMLAVHPHWQMIDQFMALSRPFSNRPFETLHRWSKDLKRYKMLSALYPVESAKISPPSAKSTPKTTVGYPENTLICGIEAVIWYGEQSGLISAADTKTLRLWSPKEQIVFSEKFIKDAESAGKPNGIVPIWYNEFMDKLPRGASVAFTKGKDAPVLVVYDSLGMQISSRYDGVRKLHFGSLQAVMLQLLTFVVMDGDLTGFKSHIPTAVYKYAFSLCQQWFAKALADPKNPKFQVLMPTVDVFGEKNWSHVYLLSRQGYRVGMGKESRNSTDKPRSAYFDNARQVPAAHYDFDPESSKLYQSDGSIAEDKPTPTCLSS
ncbi:MAG: hypothetical protein CMK92_04455 [Pseudomonas sp.]|nr:hypothetical protein [Pseudomonas sp.]